MFMIFHIRVISCTSMFSYCNWNMEKIRSGTLRTKYATYNMYIEHIVVEELSLNLFYRHEDVCLSLFYQNP